MWGNLVRLTCPLPKGTPITPILNEGNSEKEHLWQLQSTLLSLTSSFWNVLLILDNHNTEPLHWQTQWYEEIQTWTLPFQKTVFLFKTPVYVNLHKILLIKVITKKLHNDIDNWVIYEYLFVSSVYFNQLR